MGSCGEEGGGHSTVTPALGFAKDLGDHPIQLPCDADKGAGSERVGLFTSHTVTGADRVSRPPDSHLESEPETKGGLRDPSDWLLPNASDVLKPLPHRQGQL